MLPSMTISSTASDASNRNANAVSRLPQIKAMIPTTVVEPTRGMPSINQRPFAPSRINPVPIALIPIVIGPTAKHTPHQIKSRP